jgi:alkanesulfonate monooxygenase SsuD/methylene tetrahydromethanopterin reductase-like flavin-dependent oxidoreductase (luciferase family)
LAFTRARPTIRIRRAASIGGAERLGEDWASASDHFIANPVFGARDASPWNEALTSLASLAEATARIHVGVLVTSIGYRHPAVLAKMAATLDVISGGRLEFDIGAGYLEAEDRLVTETATSANRRASRRGGDVPHNTLRIAR